MSKQWFRYYESALDDPKVQMLSGDDFKAWVNMLCLASRHDGFLPPISAIAFALRCDETVAERYIQRLSDGGLIDRVSGGPSGYRHAPHNWNKRQYKSDSSNERVKRYRQRKGVTAPDTEAETDKEEDKPLLSRGGNLDGELGLDEPQQSGRPKNPSRYAFEGHVIRLTHKDFEEWNRIFHAIPDLRAELYSLDSWLQDKPDKHKGWFAAVSGMLSRKHGDAIANPRPAAGYVGSGRTLTPQEAAAARQRLIDRGQLRPETVQ